MAEEVQAEEQAPSGGMKKKLVVVGAIVALSIAIALLVFFFVLKPMLDEPAAEGEGEDEDTKIPATVVSVSFDTAIATVLKSQAEEEAELPASLLMHTVTLECFNQVTADLVEKHKPRFTHMINNLHSYRTRDELQDRLVKESVERQILQGANKILRQLQEEPDQDIKVLEVFAEWTVHDNM